MALYAIGDIQGCYDSLQRLLERLRFDPAKDRLWFTGDIVNRGPKSLEALRLVHSLGDRARCVLGNHDLHLLAVWSGQAPLKAADTLRPILEAADGDTLLDWLRHQPLLHEEPGVPYLLVHAGISPQWDLDEARACAEEVEAVLRGDCYVDYFGELYGDRPRRWDAALDSWDRLRYITNVFTRMRYCDADGALLLDYKGAPEQAPPGHYPWFEVPSRRRTGDFPRVVCGHWSALGLRRQPGLVAIDTGCLWGGTLTAVRLDSAAEEITSLPCEAALEPAPGR